VGVTGAETDGACRARVGVIKAVLGVCAGEDVCSGVGLCVVVVVHVEAALSEGGSGGQNRSGVRRGRW
jgi:hypothetical protein